MPFYTYPVLPIAEKQNMLSLVLGLVGVQVIFT